MSQLIEQLTDEHRKIRRLVEGGHFLALAEELHRHATYTEDVQMLKIVLVASKPSKDHPDVAWHWKRVQAAFNIAELFVKAKE